MNLHILAPTRAGEYKLPSEHASPVTPKDAYAWDKEKDHPFTPYMTEKEIIQEMGYDDEIDDDTLGVIAQLQLERMHERTIETFRHASTDLMWRDPWDGSAQCDEV